MCDLCEEWYHGYCINIKQNDAENIDEYDCFLCCGFIIPSKGQTYSKFDPRNSVHDRFKIAQKNRENVAKKINIEPINKEINKEIIKPIIKPIVKQIIKPKPIIKENIKQNIKQNIIPIKRISNRRAIRRPKERELPQKRLRSCDKFESNISFSEPLNKKQKITYGPPPPLQPVPPLEIANKNINKNINCIPKTKTIKTIKTPIKTTIKKPPKRTITK
eukprot:405444_1